MSKPFYESPLEGRYASEAMRRVFSPDHRYGTWRRLWLALAEAEHELGLPVTQAQLDQLRAHLDDIDYDAVHAYEVKVRHDVMAHVLALGDLCPEARPVIHLGATSCYVTDNADLLLLREALGLVRAKLCEALRALGDFALKTKDVPCLGLTHLQAAQPITVGRRAACWAQDLLQDLYDLDALLPSVRLLGCRGATGTQASFLDLFDGDVEKVEAMERKISEKLGGLPVFDVSGQTYPRKLDARVLNLLASLGISCYRFAQDVRLLQSRGELEEPFGSSQIGSSAMAYKRNPIRAERVCSLSRHLIALTQDASMTACTQWCERTLDDSANRRIALPEAFLTADAVLDVVIYVARGLTVYPKMCEKNLRDALPFIATENIMMEAVKKGGDRQNAHERIREHSQAAAVRMKQEGAPNDLLTRIAEDPELPLSMEELGTLLDPSKYVGLAPRQTERFVRDVLRPAFGDAGCKDAGEVTI
ncbi:MAG: adenylosuccinate lyase [Candidatus Aphodomonas sp.]|nr:adenylosuccinate lyase [Candidatus Aphodomonas sp.]